MPCRPVQTTSRGHLAWIVWVRSLILYWNSADFNSMLLTTGILCGIVLELLSWKSCRSSTGTYFKMSLKLFKGFILIWFEVSYLKWQAVLTTKLFAHENHQRKTPRFTLESWSSFWLHDRTCLPNKAAFKSPALRRCAGNNLPVHEQQTKEPNQTRFTINQVYCIIIYIYKPLLRTKTWLVPQGCCSSISSPQAISSSGDRRGSGRGGHRHSGHDSGGSTRNSAAAAVFCTRTGPVIDSSRTNWQIWLHPIKRSDCRRVGDHVVITAPGKTCEESGDFTAISCHGSSGVEGTNAGIYDRTAAPGGDGAALFAAAALQSAHQDSRQRNCHREDTHCRGLHTEPISGQWGDLAVLNWESLREESHWSALRNQFLHVMKKQNYHSHLIRRAAFHQWNSTWIPNSLNSGHGNRGQQSNFLYYMYIYI